MVKNPLIIAAIVAAATIGMGVFALPYVIQASGWVVALGYFVALIAVVSLAHVIYLRTLGAVHEEERLLGLARNYFGATGFWIGFFAIVIGLLLGFVAYLVLGAQFIRILLPGIPASAALMLCWLLLAGLIWGSEGRIAGLEATGVALVSFAILFIYFSGHAGAAFANMPLAAPQNFFLPFGAVLFSLAGWTSVEQVYELVRPKVKNGDGLGAGMLIIFIAGTAFTGLLYWLFALGVIGTTAHVATDTISGTFGWPIWRRDVLAGIGLASIAVVSLPLAREIRGALEKDLAWNSIASRAAIILIPCAAALSGLNDLLTIVSVAGGVFISTQYLLIISVGRRTLTLATREKILLDALSLIFVCAAIYSLYAFIVR